MPFLGQARQERAKRVALLSPGGSVSFSSLDRAAEKAARQLGTLGVGLGDVVAVKGHPDAEVVAALHGIWKAGAVVFPMNPRWTRAEEAAAIARIPVRVVLLGAGMDRVAGSQENLALGPTGGTNTEALAGIWPDTGTLPSPGMATGDSADREAVRLLTSGTSGEPRSVTLTIGNLLNSAIAVCERLSLDPSDRWLASLSVAHIGGLALVSRAALVGSPLVLGGSFRPDRFRELISEGALTHASLVPTMLAAFLELWGDRPAPRSLRCLLIGGAPADAALLERALSLRFPLAVTYGLTEATSQVATATPDLVAKKPGTVGPPLAGVELRISPESEILVRGPTVVRGLAREDGWLHTGDLGELDPDGHLFVTGRISDRIITGGVNVDPAEVEAVLRSHPGIREAVVVGVADATWGERVVAVLVPKPGMDGPLAELERLSSAVLSPAKRPREFRFLDAIPRNPNGKADRERIRDLFLRPL